MKYILIILVAVTLMSMDDNEIKNQISEIDKQISELKKKRAELEGQLKEKPKAPKISDDPKVIKINDDIDAAEIRLQDAQDIFDTAYDTFWKPYEDAVKKYKLYKKELGEKISTLNRKLKADLKRYVDNDVVQEEYKIKCKAKKKALEDEVKALGEAAKKSPYTTKWERQSRKSARALSVLKNNVKELKSQRTKIITAIKKAQVK